MNRLRTILARSVGLALVIVFTGCATVQPPPPAPPPVPVAEAAPPPVAAVPPPLPTTSPVEPPAAFKPVLYKVWYATNRMPVVAKNEIVDYAPRMDRDHIHYGNIYAEIPADFLEKSIHRGWFERLFPTNEAKLRLTKPNEIDSQVFVDELRKNLRGAAPEDNQVLIYLHGFNTTFKQAAQRAASIGYQLKMPTTAFFSWPSQGGVAKYVADKDYAQFSEDSIADFIIKIHAESGAKQIHLIAHSMGNHALLGAMLRPKMQQAIKDGLRFGQVILAAPDVETETFKKDVGVFAGISDRVSLYVSDGDLALTSSKKLAADLPRAGLRPPVVVVKTIDTIDVSSTNLTLLGHAFVSEEIDVLNDMHSLILHNDPPAKRMNIVKKDDYWELK